MEMKRKGIHLQAQPKYERLHLADATTHIQEATREQDETEQEMTEGLEDDVPKKRVEHRPHSHLSDKESDKVFTCRPQ
jgi:hypothetical protein